MVEVLSSKIDFALETGLNLFDTFIQPKLLIGSEIWGTKISTKLKSSTVNFYGESPSEEEVPKSND